MLRFLTCAFALACFVATGAAAQSTTFAFENATEPLLGTRTMVLDSAADFGLTITSADTDWQARDVYGFGNTTGKAAYAVLATAKVTLTFSTPVRLVALHGASIRGGQTWTLDDGMGHTFETTVGSEGLRIAPGFEAVTTVTITSSVSPFFPLIDNIEVEAADDATPTATTPYDAPGGFTLDLYPQPVSNAARIVLAGTDGPVRAAVFDALGREVAVLHEGPVREALVLHFDARALAAGTYLLSVEGAAGRSTRTFVVAR